MNDSEFNQALDELIAKFNGLNSVIKNAINKPVCGGKFTLEDVLREAKKRATHTG